MSIKAVTIDDFLENGCPYCGEKPENLMKTIIDFRDNKLSISTRPRCEGGCERYFVVNRDIGENPELIVLDEGVDFKEVVDEYEGEEPGGGMP